MKSRKVQIGMLKSRTIFFFVGRGGGGVWSCIFNLFNLLRNSPLKKYTTKGKN